MTVHTGAHMERGITPFSLPISNALFSVSKIFSFYPTPPKLKISYL
jgi:hypothetical protein